jgi:hypothetical protein
MAECAEQFGETDFAMQPGAVDRRGKIGRVGAGQSGNPCANGIGCGLVPQFAGAKQSYAG